MDDTLLAEVEQFCSSLTSLNIKDAIANKCSIESIINSNDLLSLEDIQVAKWTEQEKSRLIQLVNQQTSTNTNGTTNWESVAALFSDKEPMDCLMAYRNSNDPSINTSQWTAEEDTALAALAMQHRLHDWCTIASDLGTRRTPLACLQRYQMHLNADVVKDGEWSAEEDQQLLEAVAIYGTTNWTHVSNALHLRAASQCQSRYRTLIQKSKGSWSAEEERRLVLAYLATSWQALSSTEQTGGSSTGVKWCNVAKNDAQCREKWINVLCPQLNTSSFSAAEDAIILQYAPLSSSNNNRWSDIAAKLDGRTDNQVWRRWQQIAAGSAAAEYKLTASKKRHVLPKVYQR